MSVNSAARRLCAELLGTAGLLLAIVGSGITASSAGSASEALFQHAVIVGIALFVLIVTFGPASGGHFNPVVTMVDWWLGGMSARRAGSYIAIQLLGAAVGVISANLLFDQPAVAIATTVRRGAPLVASEALATFGLLMVILGAARSGQKPAAVAATVAAWIAGAIYFTPSAAFANPAVTVARALTDTFTGIAPGSVLPFVLGQLLGTALAVAVIAMLFRADGDVAAEVVVPADPGAIT